MYIYDQEKQDKAEGDTKQFTSNRAHAAAQRSSNFKVSRELVN